MSEEMFLLADFVAMEFANALLDTLADILSIQFESRVNIIRAILEEALTNEEFDGAFADKPELRKAIMRNAAFYRLTLSRFRWRLEDFSTGERNAPRNPPHGAENTSPFLDDLRNAYLRKKQKEQDDDQVQ